MLRRHGPPEQETPTTTTTTTTERQATLRRQLTALALVGDANGRGGPLLGECEGDCDSDRECNSGLTCFQRDNGEAVPGCTGDQSAWRNRDFCVRTDDSSSGGGGSVSGSGFRIKLYWQRGYFWQEESFERKWCLQCRSTCRTGVQLALRECSNANTKFEFIGFTGGQVQIKVVGKDLCMELMSSNNIDIKLQPCNSRSDRQKFTDGPGDFNGNRFELQPVAVAGCLSNPHHPRDGELIRRQGCDGARFDTTSYWNKY